VQGIFKGGGLMKAKYIANVFPFRSIKSKYARFDYRWICPGCNMINYINKKSETVHCVFCNKYFEAVVRKNFKNGDVKGINLKGM
jgi:hypothetical protein